MKKKKTDEKNKAKSKDKIKERGDRKIRVRAK